MRALTLGQCLTAQGALEYQDVDALFEHLPQLHSLVFDPPTIYLGLVIEVLYIPQTCPVRRLKFALFDMTSVEVVLGLLYLEEMEIVSSRCFPYGDDMPNVVVKGKDAIREVREKYVKGKNWTKAFLGWNSGRVEVPQGVILRNQRMTE